jgi:Collagen triple helix repeat (20 copies)/Right handed beta helix region
MGMRAGLLAVVVLTVALMLPTSAFATSAETWVSGTGKDSGTCTVAVPCASFAYAIGETSAGGEIDVLTSGSYGPVTITEPITIFASGVTAAVDFAGDSEGIFVDLTAPSETPTPSNTGVVLHGLDIDGGGTGTDAIFDDLGDVDIEDCDLYGFAQIGAGLGDLNTSKIENTMTVKDSTINGGTLGVRTFQSSGLHSGYPDQVVLDNDLIENASSAGVFTRDGEGQLTADHDLIQGNDIGFEADTGPASYMLENDEIDDNTGAGVFIYGPGAGVSQLVLDSDQINDNAGGGITLANDEFPMDALLDGDDIDYNTGDGLDVDGTLASTPVSVSNSSLSGNTATGVLADGAFADISLASDTITQNATGLEAANGGSIVSYGADNSVFGNTNNGTPSSAVSDGAVGPIGPAGAAGTNGKTGEIGATGPAGTNGPQGPPGTNGSPGPAGTPGPAGVNGSPGPAGEIELVTCTSVKKKGKKSKKTVTQKKCTSKLVSSPVSFEASAASATISRASHVDATGSLRDHKLTMHSSKALWAGRYTLKLTTGTGKDEHTSSETIVIANGDPQAS